MSMTINAPAGVVEGVLRHRGRQRASPGEKLGGTLQKTMLKEYIAQNELIFPTRPAVRIAFDMIEFCKKHVPHWHTDVDLRVSHPGGRSHRTLQELAFTLADGIGYVEACPGAGHGCGRLRAAAQVLLGRPQRLLRGDRQVPRGSADLGEGDEESASGRSNPRSMPMRTHAQTAGVSLTAQQPLQQRGANRASGAGRHFSAGPSRCTPTRFDETLRAAHRGVR